MKRNDIITLSTTGAGLAIATAICNAINHFVDNGYEKSFSTGVTRTLIGSSISVASTIALMVGGIGIGVKINEKLDNKTSKEDRAE